VIVVDSVGWIEYFSGGSAADEYAEFLEHQNDILTPTIVLHEVYKRILRDGDKREAVAVVAQMQRTNVVALTQSLAITAAECGIRHKLASADSIVYATAVTNNVEVATSDKHFEGLPGVVFIHRPCGN
jgi:predicted nucleic acid-binding protein